MKKRNIFMSAVLAITLVAGFTGCLQTMNLIRQARKIYLNPLRRKENPYWNRRNLCPLYLS